MKNEEKNHHSLMDKIGIYKVNKIKKQFVSQIKLLPTNTAEVEINAKTEKLFKKKIVFCEVAFFRNLMITFIAIILTIVPFIIDIFLRTELARDSSLSADNIMVICYAIGGVFAILTVVMILWTLWSYFVKKYILANKNSITLFDEIKIMPDKQEAKIIPPANVSFQNKSGNWFYHDGLGNYFTTNSDNQWIASSVDEALSDENSKN